MLKASLEEYNKTECSSAYSLPQLLEFDSVKDPDSTVWTEAGDLQGWRTEIPMAIKRKAVDLYCLVDRCGEEITVLKGEMNSTVHHFLTNISFLGHRSKAIVLWRIALLRVREETCLSEEN